MPIEEHRAIIELLTEAFPNCFSLYEQRRRPLKRGIYNDILERLPGVVTADELKLALRYYCCNKFYRSRLLAGAWRYDLDGNVTGSVTKEEEGNTRVFRTPVIKQPPRSLPPTQQATPQQTKHTAPLAPEVPAQRGDGFAALRAAWRTRQAGGER
jgi:sRNA-binding protein